MADIANTENLENENLQTPDAQAAENQNTTDNQENEHDINAIMARLSALEANNKKLKSLNDKYSAEIAKNKREERARMTADQQAELARLEEEEKQKNHIAELETFQKKTLAKERYLLQGMSVDLAEKAASAELDGDMDALSVIQKQHSDKQIKEAQIEWMRSRPQVNAGTGENQITKEQFAKMDLVAKSKLKRENPEEYNRLKNL